MNDPSTTRDAGAIDPRLLEILVCPETRQPVRAADAALVEELNRQVEAGSLLNRAGVTVTERLDGGLVREDGTVIYPIRESIPIMLIDESIALSPTD